MSPIGVERNKIDEIELTITIQKDASGYGMKVWTTAGIAIDASIFYFSFLFISFFSLYFTVSIFANFTQQEWTVP